MTNDIVARLRLLNSCDDDWVYTCAQEAADEIERLRAVLYEWDALIEHQYTGSREAMSDMTYAAQATAALLYGKEPWPQKTRVEKQADEIKRLRAALSRIENEGNWGPDGCWSADSYPDEIARAALTKETNE